MRAGTLLIAVVSLWIGFLIQVPRAAAQSPTINSPEWATRLVRAIYADMATYDSGPLDGVAPERITTVLARPLADARALFLSRVAPSLQHLFDDYFPFFVQRVAARLRIETAASARAFAELLLADAARLPDDEATVATARELFRSRVRAAHRPIFDQLVAAHAR